MRWQRAPRILGRALPFHRFFVRVPVSSKPVLILQLRPEDDASDNEFAAFLEHGGLTEERVRRIRVEQGGVPRVALDDYAAILVGGSPFDITTPPAEKSRLQRTIEADFHRLLDQVVERDFPFLGACSGCGLLGTYLQAAVSRRFGEPVGCATVRITEAGRDEPLLRDFPDTIDVLLGHKEAVDQLSDRATLLLTGDACPVQMFRVGQNVFATQFHPEGDAAGFALRIRVYKDHGYFPAEESESLIAAVSARDTPYAREILRRFVARYAG